MAKITSRTLLRLLLLAVLLGNFLSMRGPAPFRPEAIPTDHTGIDPIAANQLTVVGLLRSLRSLATTALSPIVIARAGALPARSNLPIHPGVASRPPLARNDKPVAAVSAYELILAMNTLRVSNGLPALVEDPIINAVAQSTAATMAASEMSWHIGDVRGRLAAAGYGGGATVWATENFAVSSSDAAIDFIMQVWADPTHMIPAVNPAYCNVGAGVAKSPSGKIYYVLQAAYTSAKSCGEYKSPVEPGGGQTGQVNPVPQIIIPVKVATPGPDGKIYHEVQAGQSFWAIAIAYKVTIKDIETWNNLTRSTPLRVGQKLFIPGSNTAGYATPTPVGMIQVSPPDKDGRIVHEVQPYNTLTTIAAAYGVSMQTILNLNGLQLDWPLQIGQKLLINLGSITPTATPRPLTPIEKLTPASDGYYYHTVRSGETLSYIAGLYEIQLASLLAWNSLGSDAIIHPDQKLLLLVTPPATITPTPQPATITPQPSSTPSPLPPTATGMPPTATPTGAPTEKTAGNSPAGTGLAWGGLLLALLAGGVFAYFRKASRG